MDKNDSLSLVAPEEFWNVVLGSLGAEFWNVVLGSLGAEPSLVLGSWLPRVSNPYPENNFIPVSNSSIFSLLLQEVLCPHDSEE